MIPPAARRRRDGMTSPPIARLAGRWRSTVGYQVTGSAGGPRIACPAFHDT
ncbi:hypothetical protein GA0070621_2058 [Micromonospora narathiwatensis]|uniref:Uncharacterized protein n=1 Tax=Micromonospora narathiwatensis TaxID=299146 RepID=A0A1A8ZKP6_9ACTN|nr:hypothetical protein GA0070621_2058 [Micromonospora narathiwatensis]